MRKYIIISLIFLVGCGKIEESVNEQVEKALLNSPVFKSLRGFTVRIPLRSAKKDTNWICRTAWAETDTPEISWDINIGEDKKSADVNITIEWQYYIYAVYRDLLDTTIIDTVKKPTTLTGEITFKFELVGNTWTMTKFTPLLLKSDSLQDKIQIDSVVLKSNTNYPVIAPSAEISLQNGETPYVFNTGDSIEIFMWEKEDTNVVKWPYAFLSGNPQDYIKPYEYDTTEKRWEALWVPQVSGHKWGFSMMMDLQSAIVEHDNYAIRIIALGIPYNVK